MSYCRWGSSDLYVYAAADGAGAEFFVCHDCPLVKEGNARLLDRQGLLAHLLEHEAAGQKTGRAIRRVRAELATGLR